MDYIVIVGSSGHAKDVIEVIERESRYRIAGLIDDFRAVDEKTMGYAVLGSMRNLPNVVATHGVQGLIIAVGDNFARAQLAERAAQLCPAVPFVTAVHPQASIARDVSIGAGSVVMAGARVNPSSIIGKHCILDANASLNHDCVMGDFSSLGPRVATGGRCRIGSHTAVGIGAVILQDVTIGEHSVIGAGAVVLKDVPELTVSFGIPAKPAARRRPGDRYL